MTPKFNPHFLIEKLWMPHSGGTKFYQAFLITAMANDGQLNFLTVGHYGGYRGDFTQFRRPVEGGLLWVKADGPASEFDDLIRRKTNDGYDSHRHPKRTARFDSLNEWTDGMVHLFGAGKSAMLIEQMKLHGHSQGLAAYKRFETEPEKQPDTESIEPTEHAPSWGTW